MRPLKSKNLLLVVPHFKAFIADQANLIKPYFKKMVVLMPMPRFSRVALGIPYLNGHFRFLKLAMDSCNEPLLRYTLLHPKFFTLPLEILRKRNSYLAARSCVKTLSRNSPDINLIHAHFLDVNGFIGAVLKNLCNKPLILTAHGGDVYSVPFRDEYYRALIDYTLKKADRVITVSEHNRRILVSLGVQHKKLNVIPNGYDETLFRFIPSNEARTRLDLPHNKKILLSIGNLVDVKGHAYLIYAMRTVSRIRKDVLLIIVGSGLLKEKLCKLIEKLDLKQEVLLTGDRKHAEIPMWMNACDVFILPSLNEGFPTVIPEAMACGKPVIGTRVGGIPEAIATNDVGVLVDPADSEALAHAILEALDRKWMPQIILNYAKRYSWDSLVSQILEIYRQVLVCVE